MTRSKYSIAALAQAAAAFVYSAAAAQDVDQAMKDFSARLSPPTKGKYRRAFTRINGGRYRSWRWKHPYWDKARMCWRPHNGAREMARRVAQMARGDKLNYDWRTT